MGKISAKDAATLAKSGVLSKKALNEMEDKGLIGKGRTSVKRFIKTAEGKFVTPCLYFRGAKDTTPSKKMQSFIADYEKLLEKYTTTKTTTNK
tara:strand:+ start:1040 stop:1318 length:279 start_codon:yes stop_codon:yes gene_type:complete